MSKILVTGGMGYIGSHTVIELINKGYEPVIADNLCNSKIGVLDRIKTITGVKPAFYKIDLKDKAALSEVFKKEKFDDVIHFAGLKCVPESVVKPLDYYKNNIYSTIALIECMKEFGVKNLVFSSSATVYGTPASVPITEEFPTGGCTNPYGQTKFMLELILKDVQKADNSFNIALLRYFNPIGAHESGLIGEDPNGIPNNLVPYITQVAVGKLPCLNVCGNDYPTPDGTGVRDYIHVVDLAKGHLAAIDKLHTGCGLAVYNLGTGKGYSVLQMVEAFGKVVGKPINYRIAPRRAGDIAECYADCSLALKELGWKAEYDLERMATDSWRWQKNNPNGLE
ncbi:MAG TPA: UDP-glucose 4-epimerase GalE [Candidatus Faecicola pullistercoris]|nr:UDP-glucose 4-epimerase GalE [Candidatus Faecicola pullistercoris]